MREISDVVLTHAGKFHADDVFAAALLLLVVELLLLDRRNPLLARFNIFAPQSGTRKS